MKAIIQQAQKQETIKEIKRQEALIYAQHGLHIAEDKGRDHEKARSEMYFQLLKIQQFLQEMG